MRFTILVTSMLIVLVAGATAAAQGEPVELSDDPARDAFQAGVEHYEAGRLDEALAEFRRAYELKPTWKILFNIGQCEAAAGRYGLALDMFERYTVEGGDEVPQQRRDYIADEVRRLQPMVGVLQVEAPDGTLIKIDGLERKTTPLKGPLRVAAGEHRVELVQGEEVLLSDTFSVAGGVTTMVSAIEDEPAPVPAVGPPVPAAEPEKPRPPRKKKGLMIAGIATFGGGYLFSALVGYLAYTEATVPEGQTCLNCEDTGKRMFIPVVGPFLAIEYADGTDGRVVSGIMGAIQVIGLGLTAWGVVLYVNSGEPEEEVEETPPAMARLRLGAAPTEGGGMLALGWTF